MSKRILVSMESCDPLDEIMTCIEALVQPGMKVVFLVHWSGDRFDPRKAVQPDMDTEAEAVPADTSKADTRDLQQQRRCEDKTLPPATVWSSLVRKLL